MRIPEEFDSIRPYEPDELPEVYDRLLANPQFQQVLHFISPNVPLEKMAEKMRSCKTNMEFQLAFCYDFLEKILKKKSNGCDIDIEAVDNKRNYTFISNHRDIVLDSALLDKLLVDAGFTTTCEIAIGDNLLSLPWVRDLVRVNKSFIVERNLPMREMLLSSKRLSEYMHFVIKEKKDNIWIAQREGRAKDSNDQTQESVLKMMALGGEGSVRDRLSQLHLVPLSISYEYDPCDYLKAQELQCRRDDPEWKKGAQDDNNSMATGILGYNGRIHFHCAPCLDEYLSTLDDSMPKNELYVHIAHRIDLEIYRNYRLYPGNYVALDLLQHSTAQQKHYTDAERKTFEDYLKGQMAKITLANKDEDYLYDCLLRMYANPTINQLNAL